MCVCVSIYTYAFAAADDEYLTATQSYFSKERGGERERERERERVFLPSGPRYEPVQQDSSQASNASAEPTAAEMKDRRWNRNPRPKPHKFSELVFVI